MPVLFVPYRAAVAVLGDHTGDPCRVARGLRARCRPVPSRWGDEVADGGEIERIVSDWLSSVAAPSAVDVVTWVPGHDGSPGPAFPLAGLVGEAWSLPVAELVVRRRRVVSAWATARRPSAAAQYTSLASLAAPAWRVVVVDNTIASGASISATVAALRVAGHAVAALVCWDRDDAGGGAMRQRVEQRWREAETGKCIRDGPPSVPARYEVDLVNEAQARRFVELHHYAHSYPPARFAYGLFDRWHDELVGVAVYAMPVNVAVLTVPFPALTSYEQ